MSERRESGLSFRVEGLRVETRGLSVHDHPELAVEASDSADARRGACTAAVAGR